MRTAYLSSSAPCSATSEVSRSFASLSVLSEIRPPISAAAVVIDEPLAGPCHGLTAILRRRRIKNIRLIAQTGPARTLLAE